MKKLRHPIRSTREPFGTAGLIIAVVALVLAVSGAALAATDALSGKQRKEVERIASKYAGVPGASGPVGPGGPSGRDGAGGKDGASGVDGKNVEVAGSAPGCPAGGVTVQVAGEGSTKKEICNVKDGETGFTETLPSGKTETGVWGGVIHEIGPVPISFAIPLSAPISEADTKIIPEGGTPPAECEDPAHTGSAGVENPEAKPGFLCIYVELTADTLVEETQAPGTGNGAGTMGTFVELVPEEHSTFGEFGKARGTWAVTAP